MFFIGLIELIEVNKMEIQNNLAYDDYQYDDESDYEIIGGEKFIMAPAANLGHSTIIGKLFFDFINYIVDNNINAAVFVDDIDVHFPDGTLLKPDLSVICNPEIVNKEGSVNGVPDLVVEVLSRSTMKKDVGIKKDIYERNGVKEYWIIDRWSKRVDVYHLIDGKFVLDDIYNVYSDEELKNMTEDDRAKINYGIKVSIFDDLIVDVRRIFKWWFE